MQNINFISRASVASPDLVLFEHTYKDFFFPKHFHETYLVEIIDKGAQDFYCSGTNYKNVQRDNLVLINPGEIHTGGNSKNTELVCKVFYPGLDAWNKIIGESFETSQSLNISSLRFKPSVADDKKIANNIKKLFSLTMYDEYNLLVKELYHQIMFDLLTKHMSSNISFDENFQKYSPAIKRAVEYVNDKISDKLLLEDIARAAYVSPFHFLRIFKNFTGITLHQYIMSLRVERAKIFLREKNNSINDTFSKLGFLNQTHFTKVFKKMTGLTPNQFRNIAQIIEV